MNDKIEIRKLNPLLLKEVSPMAAAAAMGGFSAPHKCQVEYEGVEEFNALVEKAPSVNEVWYVHTSSMGGRNLEIDAGVKPVVNINDGFGQYLGWPIAAVRAAIYESASSGSRLYYVRGDFLPDEEPRGCLAYIPPDDDPGYKGQYYEAWEEAPELS